MRRVGGGGGGGEKGGRQAGRKENENETIGLEQWQGLWFWLPLATDLIIVINYLSLQLRWFSSHLENS